jgi:hypothetical protein
MTIKRFALAFLLSAIILSIGFAAVVFTNTPGMLGLIPVFGLAVLPFAALAKVSH